jgi:mercuric ion transport protein
MNGGAACDWIQDRRVSWLWAAAFIVVAVGWLSVPDPVGAFLAAAGFMLAGALCTGNALHCRRTHCAITGPLYLIAAGLFIGRAYGLGVPAAAIVLGAVAGTGIAFIPEWYGARYLGSGGASTLATTGTLFAAGLVAACCLGPTLFVLFGVSVASLGVLGVLEPYRWLFLLTGLACWAVAYRVRRRAACGDDTCGTPVSRRLSGVVLWGSLAALLAAAIYPYVVALVV